jgi:hypothetical protein
VARLYRVKGSIRDDVGGVWHRGRSFPDSWRTAYQLHRATDVHHPNAEVRFVSQ